MDVYLKLEFDLARLRAAEWSKDLQFAAVDCAMWAYHMIDWVLVEVSDQRHIELTGFSRNDGRAIKGFIGRRLPGLRNVLEVCEQVALTSKHRVLTRTHDDPSFATGHTIRFDPPFDATNPDLQATSISVAGYLKDLTTGQEFNVIDFMEAAVANWRNFLKTERLWIYYPPDPE